MTDIANVTGLTPEQEEAVHTPAVPEPDTEDIPTVVVPAPEKPKRKRRTKAEMEAARTDEPLPAAEHVSPHSHNALGATVEQLKALDTETPEDEIGYRPANFKDPTGKQLAYIDARYIMDVLDDTVGAAAWSNRYLVVQLGQEYGVECTITITMDDGNYVSKTDVGVASSIEKMKGAYSDAFKRAAVHFGIARDLYDERMAEAPVAAVAPVAAAPVAAAPVQGTIADQTAAPVAPAVAPAEAWTCPIHGAGRIQPAGVSKRTGKAYSAFWVCTERDCDQTGGNA